MNDNKKPIVVAVSGGFDPIHVGHLEMFTKARKLGDKLIVIINNDNWIKAKKGRPFMPESERATIIAALKMVDDVVLTEHELHPEDMSVASALLKIKPDIFANGGDRSGETNQETAEEKALKTYGDKMVYGVGEKIQSSSWLLNDYLNKSS